MSAEVNLAKKTNNNKKTTITFTVVSWWKGEISPQWEEAKMTRNKNNNNNIVKKKKKKKAKAKKHVHVFKEVNDLFGIQPTTEMKSWYELKTKRIREERRR